LVLIVIFLGLSASARGRVISKTPFLKLASTLIGIHHEGQLNRLHGPIGLEIGAGTPEEIAVSIVAEIVAARNSQGNNH